MQQLSKFVITTVLLLSAPLPAAEVWLDDFDQALKQAQKEKKYVLVDFTGSDWCGWCITLKKEVFSHKKFQQKASEDFVLVALDFPKKPENLAQIPPERQARNRQLSNQYEVQGFPTIKLLDSEGRPFGTTGYQPGGVDAYLKHLDEFVSKQRAIEAWLQQAQDDKRPAADRANLLHKALEAMDPMVADTHYSHLMKQIIELDADNGQGLNHLYRYRVRLQDADNALQANKPEEAIKLLKATFDELTLKDEQRLELHYFLSMINEQIGNSGAMIDHLRQALAVPLDNDQIKAALQQRLNGFLVPGGYAVASTPGYYMRTPSQVMDGRQDTYYLSGRSVRAGDTFQVVFDAPRKINTIKAATGREGESDGQLAQGVLEISPDGKVFEPVAQFVQGRVDIGLEQRQVKALRIRCTADQTSWVAYREIEVR